MWAKLTGQVLVGSLNRYIASLGCPAEFRSPIKTCSETVISIYNSVYKLIALKCPESMEPHSVKSKSNGIDSTMAMKDDDCDAQVRKKAGSQNGNKRVYRFDYCADCSVPLDRFWLSFLPMSPDPSIVSVKQEELSTERIFR